MLTAHAPSLRSVAAAAVVALALVLDGAGPARAETYDLVAKWGSLGSGSGQFNTPYGVTVASSGSVYLADALNNRIQRFNTAGTFLNAWGSVLVGKNGSLNTPFAVAADNNGYVWVRTRAIRESWRSRWHRQHRWRRWHQRHRRDPDPGLEVDPRWARPALRDRTDLPAGRGCLRGTLTVVTVAKYRTSPKGRRKVLALGSGRYALAAGSRGSVRLRLSVAVARALALPGGVRIEIVLNPGGGKTVSRVGAKLTVKH